MRLRFYIGICCLCSAGVQAQVVAGTGEPFKLRQRIQWAAKTAVSPRRFAGYTVSSAISTATNSPREYGPHWEGYGKRIGLRMSTGATGLMMESMIGALWGEDPR